MLKAIQLSTDGCMNDALVCEVIDAGFKGLDIFYSTGFLADDVYEENANKLRERLDKIGLVCTQVHLPGYAFFMSSELEHEGNEKRIKNALHTMQILGAKWGAYHPLSSTNFDYDPKRAMHDNKEKLKRFLETAQKYDVGIAVENLPIFPDCPQYNFFTSNPEDHMQLIDDLNSDKIGICWDFGHANLMPYNQAEVLDTMGERVKIIHVHNNNTQCDAHLCPAIGTIKWEEIIPVLRKHNFSGALSLEINLKLIHTAFRKDYINMCGAMADKMLNF